MKALLLLLPVGVAALLLAKGGSAASSSSASKKAFASALGSDQSIGLGVIVDAQKAIERAEKEGDRGVAAMRAILSRLESRVRGEDPPPAQVVEGMKSLELGELVGYLYQLEGDVGELRAWADALQPYGDPVAVGLLQNKAYSLEHMARYGTVPGQAGSVPPQS